MPPRRILILTNRIPFPLHDGGALAMDAMIRGYANAGLEVYLLAMLTSRHPVAPGKLKQLYPYIYHFETVPVDNRIRPHKVAANLLFSRDPEHAGRFYSIAFKERLVEVLAQFNPDIVQVESLFLSSYLPHIRKGSKAVTVLRMHNVEYQIWERLAGESSGRKKAYLRVLASRMKRYETGVWKEYDLLLPITAADDRLVQLSQCSTPRLVAPFGIELKDEEAPKSIDIYSGYHIGAMDWLPNAAAMDWLLQDIWPEIRKAAPGFRFHFAGRHMPERFLGSLPEGVQCGGEVADAAAFIADKNILLVPLRAGGGIRVKILEAMAAGKPVVSTDTGMQGIEAIPGIHYLTANTPAEFAAAITSLLSSPEDAVKMSIAAGALIKEKYDQRLIMQRLLQKLESMMPGQQLGE